jgi:uncharacterized lipoprotein YajG
VAGFRMHRSITAFLLAGVAATILSGCSTTSAGLKYESAGVPKDASSGGPISLGVFVDERGETPSWLGVIRGGFGNPIKTLEGDQPVAELVRTGFIDGLKTRGYEVTADAPVTLSGTVRRFDADQYVRREANAEIEVRLTGKGHGAKPIFERTFAANQIEGSALSLQTGIFGSVEELRAVLQKTLGEVIDKALDDPQLRAALR